MEEFLEANPSRRDLVFIHSLIHSFILLASVCQVLVLWTYIIRTVRLL